MLMLRYGGGISSVLMLKKKRPSSNSIYVASAVVGVVNNGNGEHIGRRWYGRPAAAAAGLVAAAMMFSTAWAWRSGAIEAPETLSNIPQTLSGECPSVQDCKKARIQRPKSRKAESCTIKPLVVFKQGFRSRQYCLVECSDICNLIGDGDDGP
ncbi:hypothetical protein CK203_101690 [Vitis vinifera]|uniref:Uncharacterized protein n=1 Tax=Vitis vinifera TaxID=29760 RepID=A0A438FH24_VITVI|nr:hypothetical protein CK203_101690 [Vitis vinifera]